MTKSTDSSAVSRIERVRRQQTSMQEKALALAEFEVRAVAVRKNMARLRALREAKETEDRLAGIAADQPATPARRRRRPSPNV